MQWRSASTGPDAMRGTGDDEISYATGWTISGLEHNVFIRKHSLSF